jgi:cytochrome-b5 reductase
MLRVRLPARPPRLRPSALSRATLLRRHASQTSSPPPPEEPSPAQPRGSRRTLLVALGASGLGLAAYLLQPTEPRGAPTDTRAPLSTAHFTPTTLVASVPTGPDTKLLTLQLPAYAIPPAPASSDDDASRVASGNASVSPPLKPVWSIYIKDADIMVERAYTPLEGLDAAGRLTLWVKRYPRGEVGRWLHTQNVGDTIEIRGPFPTWPFQEDWDEIVMVRARSPSNTLLLAC